MRTNGHDHGQDGGTGRLPDVVVIGAMRSGTTWLHHQLDAHPDITMVRPKEPHFFDAHFECGVGWYTERIAPAAAGGSTLVGEATQTYLYDDRCPGRMASVIPDAKLIAVLRNPVDRAYSHYWLNRTQGRERRSFEEALDEEAADLAAATSRRRRRWSYVDRGRYLVQLRRVVDHYPRSALQVLLFDDCTARPVETLVGVWRFLGVDAGFVPPSSDERVNGFVQYRSTRLRDAGRRLPEGRRKLISRVNTRRRQYPPMEPATRRRLLEVFQEDNAALAAWLDRDLSRWGHES